MGHGFIPVPNCASVELIYLLNGITAENVLYVHKGSPYSLADLQAVRTIVNSWDAATWFNARGIGCTLVRIRTKALDASGSPMEDFTLPTPRAGSINSPLLPGNASFAIKLSTGRTGRSFRGRLYFVGLTSAVLGTTANQILASTSTLFVSWLNTLLSNLATGGHTLGVVSYRSNHVFRANGLFTQAVNWVAVDNNIDSMRRRLTGRGI